jgi:hypothetical protein
MPKVLDSIRKLYEYSVTKLNFPQHWQLIGAYDFTAQEIQVIIITITMTKLFEGNEETASTE